MAWTGSRRFGWPSPTREQLIRLSQILVVDDKGFEYTGLFERDGYHLTNWDRVKDLQRMESGEFHVILLDLRGIGVEEAEHEGAGLIEHIKKSNPAQYIIAYSSSVFSLEYQKFFEHADGSIKKSEDYATFKRQVDEGLRKRFSYEYYVSLVQHQLGIELDKRARREFDKAIAGQASESLRSRLTRQGVAEANVDRALTVASIASNAYLLLKTSVLA